MSSQITAAFVEQFRSNVEHLAQQDESRLASCVRRETQTGKTEYFDQLGATTAVLRTTRHSDTPRLDVPHRRRAVTCGEYEASDLIDTADKAKVLQDPASDYMKSFVMALHRAKDVVISTAAVGTAYADTTGAGSITAVTLPAAQKVAVDYVVTGSAANSGLTLGKLTRAKHILGTAEFPKGTEKYIAVSQQQVTDLLNNVSQVSSADYANVKALVEGEVDYFMGFKFRQLELLALNSSTDVRTCFAWYKPALLMSTGVELMTRVTERDDKSYSVQPYAMQSIGATRMQENGVAEVLCDQSP